MKNNPLPDSEIQRTVDTYKSTNNLRKAAKLLGIAKSTLQERLRRNIANGRIPNDPVFANLRVSQVTIDKEGMPTSVQYKPERGPEFKVPDGHSIKGISAFVDESGREIAKWVKTKKEFPTEDLIRTVVNELKKEIAPVKPTKAPNSCEKLLLNQYTVTDSHFGQLSWGEETGGNDYDIKKAEKLLLDWFTMAISLAPAADTAIFAQLGDFMHHDSIQSVTPEHRNVLDADSRLQKIIRVVIRVARQIISMLLAKHRKVHIIWASANHDPASSAWMRELLASLYNDEPRVTIDNSPDIYYSYEFGDVALFYHHGHRKSINNIDSVFAGKFKELYGNSKKTYGHIGHMHSDGVVESNLMRVERHRTLAPADAYSSGLGHTSGRDAKIIIYHAKFGEVSRITVSPEMVMNGGKP